MLILDNPVTLLKEYLEDRSKWLNKTSYEDEYDSNEPYLSYDKAEYIISYIEQLETAIIGYVSAHQKMLDWNTSAPKCNTDVQLDECQTCEMLTKLLNEENISYKILINLNKSILKRKENV